MVLYLYHFDHYSLLILPDQLRFNVSKGLIKYLSNKLEFKNSISLNNPITNCDIFYNGFLKRINIFTNKNKQSQHEFNTEIIEFNSMLQQHQQQKTSNIYIGKYNSQIYAQNIKYEDEEDELFKKRFLFENNKEMLQKTKSTMNNNLVIPNKYSKNQQQNQIALINHKNYDIFFQEAVLVGENNELSNHNDDDDDDDGKNYHLLVPDENQFIVEFDYFINNYINMILFYKKMLNYLLQVSSIIFIIFLSFKRSVLFLLGIIFNFIFFSSVFTK
jgi:hypothetical protein